MSENGQAFEKVLCNSCSKNGTSTEAAIICSDCNENMCTSCSNIHKKDPKNALHRLVDIGTFRGCTFANSDINTKANAEKFNGHIIQPLTKKKITYLGSIKLEKDVFISSICVTQDGRLFVCNTYSKDLMVFSEEGDYIEKCGLAGTPWDIALIHGGKSVAVTLDQRFAIQFITTVPSVKAGQCLSVGTKCYGIAVVNHLVCLGCKGAIRVLDNHGQLLSSFEVGHDGFLWYLYPLPNGNVCYTSYDYNEIVSFDPKTGKLVSKYSNGTLKGPEAIAADNVGHLYVSCRDSNNIQRLSLNCEFIGALLLSDIKKPYALSFNANCSKLFVSNNDGTSVAIYQIS